ncbi:unnamed protein product, partial [Rotaria sordida]
CDREIFYESSNALFVDSPLKFYSQIIYRAITGWLKNKGYDVF